jgi:hypothetical protein
VEKCGREDWGKDDPAALRQRPYRTDRMEHTVLGLQKVTSAYYQAEQAHTSSLRHA